MLTSDLNLSKNCKRIEILKCVLKNVHYYYYYYLGQISLVEAMSKVKKNVSILEILQIFFKDKWLLL